MADHLGYYAEAGLTAEGVKGTTDVEGLGTGKVDVASGMMAKMLVPITNGVDITFVGGSAYRLQVSVRSRGQRIQHYRRPEGPEDLHSERHRHVRL